MARHSRSSEDRDRHSTSTSRSSQREPMHLPPISQAVPEIGWTNANIAEYRRKLDHNPRGPAAYDTSRSLVSPSSSSSKATSRPTLEVPVSRPRSRHGTPSSGSSRSMPIHGGPPHRNSVSSSSSDFSSNRRTTNTSPSASPNDSAAYLAPVRKPSPERIHRADAQPRRPQGQPAGFPASPYGPFHSQGVRTAPASHWDSYEHQIAGPIYSSEPRYPVSPHTVIPHPGYQTAPSSYTTYPSSQPDATHYSPGSAPPQYGMGFSNVVETGEPRSKKRRGNLPKWQTDLMRAWYNAHIRNPYPTEAEKHQMVRDTGLTLEQVSNWFINCRRRHGPQLSKDAEAESMLRRAHADSSQGSTEPSPRIKELSPRQRYRSDR